MAVTPQAGKYYRTRDGQVAGPLQRRTSTMYPWLCTNVSRTFTDEGYVFNPGSPDDCDLMWECTPQGHPLPAQTAAPQVVQTIPVTVGQSGSSGVATGGAITRTEDAHGNITWTCITPDGTVTHTHQPAPAKRPGNIVDQAIAADRAAETAEQERMRKLPSAEERLAEYRRNVARLMERGGLYS